MDHQCYRGSKVSSLGEYLFRSIHCPNHKCERTSRQMSKVPHCYSAPDTRFGMRCKDMTASWHEYTKRLLLRERRPVLRPFALMIGSNPAGHSGERGNAILEAALIFLPMMAIFLGIVDVSLAVFIQSTLTSATRDGARFAITYRPTYNGNSCSISHAACIAQVVQNNAIGLPP